MSSMLPMHRPIELGSQLLTEEIEIHQNKRKLRKEAEELSPEAGSIIETSAHDKLMIQKEELLFKANGLQCKIIEPASEQDIIRRAVYVQEAAQCMKDIIHIRTNLLHVLGHDLALSIPMGSLSAALGCLLPSTTFHLCQNMLAHYKRLKHNVDSDILSEIERECETVIAFFQTTTHGPQMIFNARADYRYDKLFYQ